MATKTKKTKAFKYVLRTKKAEAANVAWTLENKKFEILAAYRKNLPTGADSRIEFEGVDIRPLSVVINVLSDDFRVNVLSEVLTDVFGETELTPNIPFWS